MIELDLKDMLDRLNAIQHHSKNNKVVVDLNLDQIKSEICSKNSEIASASIKQSVDIVKQILINNLNTYVSAKTDDDKELALNDLKEFINDLSTHITDKFEQINETWFDIPYSGIVTEIECRDNITKISVDF